MSERESSDFFKGTSNEKFVTDLSPADFDDMNSWKLKKHKCSMVLFYCAWCPHCRDVKDNWAQVGRIAVYADICGMNCEKYKSHISKIKEEIPELIKGYPTIVIYKKGEPVEVYKDSDRSVEALLKVCEKLCKNDTTRGE